MIVTVTLNPSLDRTVEVDRLVRGAVHRARGVRVEAGGKGVNITRALTANGHRTLAVLPCGGSSGQELSALLVEAGIDFRTVAIAEDVRTNVSVVEPDGTVTKRNAPGPALTAEDVTAVVKATGEAAAGARWVACSGSLPPGTPPELYATLVEVLHGAGCSVAVDSSGAAFAAAVASGPEVVKPNHEELAEAVGRDLRTLGDVAAAARELRRRGPGAVLVRRPGGIPRRRRGTGVRHQAAGADGRHPAHRRGGPRPRGGAPRAPTRRSSWRSPSWRRWPSGSAPRSGRRRRPSSPPTPPSPPTPSWPPSATPRSTGGPSPRMPCGGRSGPSGICCPPPPTSTWPHGRRTWTTSPTGWWPS